MIGCKFCNFTNVTLFLNLTSKRNTRSHYFSWSYDSCPRKSCLILCSSGDRQNWNSIINGRRRIQGRTGKSEEEEKGERKVHCEVEVISWRERRIKAEIVVKADVESVWNALTDYERLADFVPNLVSRYSLMQLFLLKFH